MKQTLCFLVLSLIFWSGSLVMSEPVQAKTTRYTILIEDMKFNPPELTVHVGDQISWANKDLVPHTVTAVDKSFDSKTILPGASWIFTPDNKNILPYECMFHPAMKAKIKIE